MYSNKIDQFHKRRILMFYGLKFFQTFTRNISQLYPKHVKIIDLRSDTLSKPSLEMRKQMFEAEVGDDVLGEDPTVKDLENKCANMLGKERAIFSPSGRMSNLLAVMSQSTRGSEIVVGHKSHISTSELTGMEQIAGVMVRTVADRPDGTFDEEEVTSTITNLRDRIALVCIENTHSRCGGRVLLLPWIKKLKEVLKEFKLPLHMDGARFFNAVVKSGYRPDQMAKYCDTISICLSKGLGAPLGSLLVGPEKTILRARDMRRMLGGGMRQVGLVAAAGIYALDHMIDRLEEDHTHAYAIGKSIQEMNSKVVSVELHGIETNIIIVNLNKEKIDSESFCRRLAMVTDSELKEDMVASIKASPWDSNTVRMVICCNHNKDDVQLAINKLETVIKEYDNNTVFL